MEQKAPVTPGASASWFVSIERKCNVCLKPASDEECITCDKCSEDCHLTCSDLPAYELVKYFKKNLYKRKYMCCHCVEKIHPNDVKRINVTNKKHNSSNQNRTEESTQTETTNIHIQDIEHLRKEREVL